MTGEISTRPFAPKNYQRVKGRRMAYIDEGKGDAIVFQHGNPTSSYLWRNVMPHLRGMGRLVACDLVGMGDSEKLTPAGPDRYHYEEQRDYLFALWDALSLGDRVVLVLHDWGSAVGFEWATRHPGRVQGIAYMEAIVAPRLWSDYPEGARRDAFRSLRSPEGESLVLDGNAFVERVLPGGIKRTLTDTEMAEYRRPFLQPGEDRRPTLSWPRDLPIEGEPKEVVRVVTVYGAFLARSQIPKLFINADPGALLTGRLRDFCRTWPNQTEVSVSGLHFMQEDSPHDIGEAIADFVRRLRGA
ncbi:MAG: haloalkane dehalogenase [Stellaceae bacterium]